MSTGLIGTIGSVATGQLQQGRIADADRTTQEVSNQQRRAESNKLATAASGIGQTEQEGEASDRDADGRRPWEHSAPETPQSTAEELETTSTAIQSKDPTGNAGKQIDLSG